MRKILAMKRIYAAATVTAMVAILFCACAGTSRIAKSGDPELIYNTALKYYNEEKWNRAAGPVSYTHLRAHET